MTWATSVPASVERHPGGQGSWIGLYSGRRLDPFDPHPEDIALEDIAHALSHAPRFTGHTTRLYSVAQHSVLCCRKVTEAANWHRDLRRPLVARLVLECERQALLHDASEAYLCDLARPVKYHPGMAAYRDAEARLQAAIFRRFGVAEVMHPAVKTIDDRMLVTEAQQLLTGQDLTDWQLERFGPPFAMQLTPWSPDDAKAAYLGEARRLGLS
ncbi:phosphohydrolase [Luteitalea sp.]